MQQVSKLTDTDNWTWKGDLLCSTFLLPDVDATLNIPLRNGGGGDDFWAWAFEQLGSYTVKSMYCALVTRKECLALEEVGGLSSDGLGVEFVLCLLFATSVVFL